MLAGSSETVGVLPLRKGFMNHPDPRVVEQRRKGRLQCLGMNECLTGAEGMPEFRHQSPSHATLRRQKAMMPSRSPRSVAILFFSSKQ